MNPDVRNRVNALMIQLADGDRSVFDEVYAALWPVVTSFCARMIPGADAEDAAQLALMKVFGRASNFDRSGDAFTWVLAIAAWEVRTVQRQVTRSRTTTMENHEVADPAESAEAILAREELVAAARQALGGLSEADRETLLATFNDENPAGVGGATFRKRRERALARLKEAWRSVYGN